MYPCSDKLPGLGKAARSLVGLGNGKPGREESRDRGIPYRVYLGLNLLGKKIQP